MLQRLGRSPKSRLYAGLKIALAFPEKPKPEAAPAHARAFPAGPGAVGEAGSVVAIAVLPFSAQGETADPMRSVAEQVTDDLTNILSRVSALRVISRQTMRSYAGQKFDVGLLGKELGARYVLEGNMRMHGDRLRVNVELVDTESRMPAWSTRIDQDPAEQHKVQDEIVARLGRELAFSVYRLESERVSSNPSIRTLNYQGWSAIFEAGSQGVEALKRAERSFNEILALEPDHHAARHGIGHFHVLMGSLSLDADKAAHLGRGEELLRDVLQKTPDNASAHFAMGILLRFRGNLSEALSSYQRAVAINPSNAPGYSHIGHTLLQMGKPEEAIKHIRYALRLSPRDPSRSHWLRFAGEAELELGRVDEALALLTQSYELNKGQPLTLRSLAAVHALAGQPDQASRYVGEMKSVAAHLTPERMLRRPGLPEGAQPELMRGFRMAIVPRG